MNANQIINMIMRLVMRKVINKGINMGINGASQVAKKSRGKKPAAQDTHHG